MNADSVAGSAPASAGSKGHMVLFHGAGSNRDHAELVAIERECALHSSGWSVERRNFAYRDEGRRLPGHVAGLLAEFTTSVKRIGSSPLVVGGRSLGGRVASMAVAEGFKADGLVLIAYPIRSKSGQLRDQHLGSIQVPTLIVSGDRDPYCPVDLLRHHCAAIDAPVELVIIEGCGHELKGAEPRLAATVSEWASRRFG